MELQAFKNHIVLHFSPLIPLAMHFFILFSYLPFLGVCSCILLVVFSPGFAYLLFETAQPPPMKPTLQHANTWYTNVWQNLGPN